jgi:hypothetical protein
MTWVSFSLLTCADQILGVINWCTPEPLSQAFYGQKYHCHGDLIDHQKIIQSIISHITGHVDK